MSAKSFEWKVSTDTVTATTEFPCFTMDEYANLQGRVLKQIKDQNRQLAIEIQFLSEIERGKFLRESDPRSVSVLEVENYINDDRNARNILKFSLTKAGKQPDEADIILAEMNVMERCAVAKHVAGLIDLQPIPEEDRKATWRMEALIRKNFPGVDPGELTVGQFYALIEELVPQGEGDAVKGWFIANTKSGTTKEQVA